MTQNKPVPTGISQEQDLLAVKATGSRYTIPVLATRGLRAVVSARGLITWQCFARTKSGNGVTKNIGTYPALKLKDAITKSISIIDELKNGIHPKYLRRKDVVRQKSLSEAAQPITNLSRALIKHKLTNGTITKTTATLDEYSVSYLEDVINKKSFLDFDHELATKISNAYPADTALTKREKSMKMLLKTYRSLSQTAKAEIYEDIPNLIKASFGDIPTRSRHAEFISTTQLSKFWAKLQTTETPNSLHKDFLVLCLLTGERKSALLGIKLADIDLRDRRIVFIEGKRSGGKTAKNVLPITPMLGALIDRLARQATKVGSEYLFPQQRVGKNGKFTHLSKIDNKFLNSLGNFNGVKPNPHNLRRTLANMASLVTGSQSISDEHILHFTRHTSGAAKNYLDPTSLDFAEVRKTTFEASHKHLDDWIISGARPSYEMQEHYGQELTYELPKFLYLSHPNPATCALPVLPIISKGNDGIHTYSPLGSFCAGKPVLIQISPENRPLTYKKLIQDDSEETYRRKFSRANYLEPIT
jgi:integrase